MSSPSKRLIAIFVLIGNIVPAYADPTMECSIKNETQVDTGACLADILKTVDTVLETSLSFAMDAANELDNSTGRTVAAPALKKAQAEWLQYRDSHCDFVGSTFGGGSGTGIAIQDCQIRHSRARSDELMKFTQ